jgi:hypothetical protein
MMAAQRYMHQPQSRPAKRRRTWAIDGGPVRNLPGVGATNFGHGQVEPEVVKHAELITGILHKGLPNQRIRLLSALPARNYRARDRQVAKAIRYADKHGARVVNFSGAAPIRQPKTLRAIRKAKDTLFVVAGRKGNWPAVSGAPNVLTVGKSHAPEDRGSAVRVAAPSTSEATADATVRVAHILQRHPNLSPQQLKRISRRRFEQQRGPTLRQMLGAG